MRAWKLRNAAEQFTRLEIEGVLQPAELFVAGGVRNPAGLDEREVGLGNARLAGEVVERQAEAASLAADFGAESFHGSRASGMGSNKSLTRPPHK